LPRLTRATTSDEHRVRDRGSARIDWSTSRGLLLGSLPSTFLVTLPIGVIAADRAAARLPLLDSPPRPLDLADARLRTPASKHSPTGSERHLTFHGLRHEHASLLLSAGVPITAVSKRLGHASAAITSDHYSRLLEDADGRMADAAESVLGFSAQLHTHCTHMRGSDRERA
jgi:hypothetical protein